jgi:hypothetical protein
VNDDVVGHELEDAAREWLSWQRKPTTRSIEESQQARAAERRLMEAIDAVLGDDET